MNYTVEIGNVTIQITNSEIQNNYIEGNFSKIDLDGCEGKLRSIYEINKDIPLLIFKVDYYKNDSLIPIIEYEIYNPKNLSILDLSYCINNNNNTINIFIPVSIDEKVLFKYDPNSDYYTNSCYSYTTENGTDIILKDRQKEYINNNMRVCEKKCKFIKYDQITNKVCANVILKKIWKKYLF